MKSDPELFLEIDEFKVLLKARTIEAGGISEFARQFGITRTLLHAMLNGQKPSVKVLEKLGARYVIAVGKPPAPKKKS